MKSTIDIMAFGSLLIGIWLVTNLLNKFTQVGFWCGLIGGIVYIIVEGIFLVNRWRKKS